MISAARAGLRASAGPDEWTPEPPQSRGLGACVGPDVWPECMARMYGPQGRRARRAQKGVTVARLHLDGRGHSLHDGGGPPHHDS